MKGGGVGGQAEARARAARVEVPNRRGSQSSRFPIVAVPKRRGSQASRFPRPAHVRTHGRRPNKERRSRCTTGGGCARAAPAACGRACRSRRCAAGRCQCDLSHSAACPSLPTMACLAAGRRRPEQQPVHRSRAPGPAGRSRARVSVRRCVDALTRIGCAGWRPARPVRAWRSSLGGSDHAMFPAQTIPWLHDGQLHVSILTN
jgi:hypothetical protein